MDTLIVNAKDENELNFLSDLFKRMNIQSKVLSIEDKEDFALGEMMSKIDRTQKVSRDKIMSRLGRK
jgi:hypothetical protein